MAAQGASQKATSVKGQAKKAAVATAPEPQAHHATLSESQCSDCAVGILRKYASESLREQKKADPGNQHYQLKDDEEIELLRTTPLALQLVGLRRERSISNRFDDLLVVLYAPALLKEGQKRVLEAEGLRVENLADAQTYVETVLGEAHPQAPKEWPFPGVDVSCPKCMHWRVAVFPITTEPGYDDSKPSATDAQGKKLPDFDNLTLLPFNVGAIAPGIYNAHYRVGLHKGGSNPPTSYAALQFCEESIPARRRYPIVDLLKYSQAAHDRGTDEAIRARFIQQDAAVQKEARARIEQELGSKRLGQTAKQKKVLAKAVAAKLSAWNAEHYAARVAEYRKQQATGVFEAFKARLDARERCIRLEDAGGAETENFEAAGRTVSRLEVVDDAAAPMKSGIQLVFTEPASHPPLRLTAETVLVTFGTAASTNIHQSVDTEQGAWRRNREVNRWSEGCQVFRSPDDFKTFLRMAMLSKRALCPMRQASCHEPLTVEQVEKALGKKMQEVITHCPKALAETAREALVEAFTCPVPAEEASSEATPVRGAAEAFVAEGNQSVKNFDKEIRSTLLKVFTNDTYPTARILELLQRHAQETTLAGLLSDQAARSALQVRPLDTASRKVLDKALSEARATGMNALHAKLAETKDAWVKAQHKKLIEGRHREFQKQHLEPCDFGACGFRFDYMLAEITRARMESFVAKLGDRSWDVLFPEDAPPPPARPTAKARVPRPSASVSK